ncbi:MAG: hypothetical protein R2788_22075 [Saprospiraceae bacterium]
MGKFHMGEKDDKPQPGFDYWASFQGQGVYYNPVINKNGEHLEYKDSTYITDLLTDYALEFWKKEKRKNLSFCTFPTKRFIPNFTLPSGIWGNMKMKK